MARGYLVSLDKAVSGYSVAFVVFYNGAKLQTVEQGYRILVLVADDVSEKQQFPQSIHLLELVAGSVGCRLIKKVAEHKQ